MSVGKFIRKRRLEVGLSLRELARLAYISHGFLSKMERGLIQPPTVEAVLRRIARALEIEDEDTFILICGQIPGWLKQTIIEYPELMLVIKDKKLPLKDSPASGESLH